MQVVYARQPLPTQMVKSIFLAGPTPRNKDTKSWRPEALELLKKAGFDGHVFVPEPEDGNWASDYDGQIKWEDDALNQSDCILFWIPRDLETMPAFTTNDEWGYWKDSGKVVLGAPEDAAKVQYQKHYAKEFQVPLFATLKASVEGAVERVGEGALRVGGEVKVPLFVWREASFQGWLRSQMGAGNRMLEAKLLWTYRIGETLDRVFSWSLQVKMFNAAERRSKDNEYVFGRWDISSVVLWHRAATLAATEIVLVKEFRNAARTMDGFIREVPGGSSKTPISPAEMAVEELRQEIMFSVSPSLLKSHSFRQLHGTLSASGAYVFSMEITDEELDFFRSIAGEPHGEAQEGERTYVEVHTVESLLKNPLTDWATLGMIFSALAEAMR